MHAALGRVDVVGKGDHDLVVAVVVLHGDLGHGVVLAAGHVDGRLVDRGLVPVDVGDELADAALVAHRIAGAVLGAQVRNRDLEAGVQEGLLAHPPVEGLVVVLQGVEHLGVGLEGDGRAGVVAVADHAHFLGDGAAGEFHLVDLALLVDLDLEPLGQGVDDRRADAVQAAGDLVAAAAELAAGVQDREDDLKRGPAGLGLDIDGDAAAVVADCDRVAGVDRDPDVVAEAGERLVDGVVDDLIDQVVQSGLGGRADVHARALADGLEAFQNLDLRGVVFLLHGHIFLFFVISHMFDSFADGIGDDRRVRNCALRITGVFQIAI